jgi:hypothetical protein
MLYLTKLCIFYQLTTNTPLPGFVKKTRARDILGLIRKLQ